MRPSNWTYTKTNPSGTVVTPLIDLTQKSGYAASIVLTGTLVCTVNLGGTAQYLSAQQAGTTLPPTLPVISSTTINMLAATSYTYNNVFIHYLFGQLQFSSFSGTGTLTVYFNAKDF